MAFHFSVPAHIIEQVFNKQSLKLLQVYAFAAGKDVVTSRQSVLFSF